MRVAIIGHGYVGEAMEKFFSRRYETFIYDPWKGYDSKGLVNACDLAVVCVPTPQGANGRCDISIVHSTVQWLKTPLILIKSTVFPGTTKKLKAETNKRIVFSPEYLGESQYYTAPEYPHPTDAEKHRFFIFGGDKKDTSECIDIFAPIVGPHPFYYQVDETTAEVIKYWENAWGAMKVTFCNEMAEVCKTFDVDYWEAREGWALDSRVEKMHSAVFKENRGFGGKCFPKDLMAIYMACKDAGYDSDLFKNILKFNRSS